MPAGRRHGLIVAQHPFGFANIYGIEMLRYVSGQRRMTDATISAIDASAALIVLCSPLRDRPVSILQFGTLPLSILFIFSSRYEIRSSM